VAPLSEQVWQLTRPGGAPPSRPPHIKTHARMRTIPCTIHTQTHAPTHRHTSMPTPTHPQRKATRTHTRARARAHTHTCTRFSSSAPNTLRVTLRSFRATLGKGRTYGIIRSVCRSSKCTYMWMHLSARFSRSAPLYACICVWLNSIWMYVRVAFLCMDECVSIVYG
jgi:hypothetical protein